jgi:hypothetical protein
MYINIKDSNDIIEFEVSDFKNEFKAYLLFQQKLIKKQDYIVSFNGLQFDAQVAVFCIKNRSRLLKLNGGQIAREIFKFVQELIDLKNETGWLKYPIKDLPFNEIDVAAINNYNNKQKFASLKWLQYNMDWHNIMDMNCKPDDILTPAQIKELRRYCINDCLSTRELLIINIPLIKVREDLSEHFQLELQNLSEPKLVKAILMDLLSKDMGIKQRELKDMQTFRDTIHLKDAILPYISFKTKPLQKTLDTFKGLKLDGENLKGSFKHKVTYRGLEFSFALGGIHGAKRGLYKRGKGMIVKSFDVKSYYPNLCIRNGWSPAHLPADIFGPRYEWFYNERLKYPKSNPLNYLYKIVLNSAFGLSNDKHSFLKDGLLTMQITCNGQLLLVQLMEELCEKIPGARPVMVNTDGGEIVFPEEYEDLYDEICQKWEKLTNLVLEYEHYEKLIIWDVNNYIGIFKGEEIELEKAKELFHSSYPKPLIKKVDGKWYHYPVKCKGRFDVNKELHKNKSFRVKALALYNHFVHDMKPERTLEKCDNIYDYCAGIRAKGDWKIKQTCIEDGEIFDYDTQKTVRYFVSGKGCKLIKEEKKIATERIETKDKKGETIKLYEIGDTMLKTMKVEASSVLEQVAIEIDDNKDFKEYNINKAYYLRAIRSEIESVEPVYSQTTLL